MYMTFRWYGPDDEVSLQSIRQIPGVTGIVSSLYHRPSGEAWEEAELLELKRDVEEAGLDLKVIESVPVHEDIKLGRSSRDRYIENYCRSIENIGMLDIPVICYNFMPVFDWTRTDLARPLEDGSTTLAYDDRALTDIDLSKGTGNLPGWGAAYSAEELNELRQAYASIEEEQLWANLGYFLEQVVPVAEENGVALGIHPDDPPWSIFDLPRIITDEAALQRVVDLVDSPANGLTICTGSLGPDPDNDLPRIIRRFGRQGRIHFAHCRNIRRTGKKVFHETPHPSSFGDVHMLEVMKAYADVGYEGPVRPDHGRMIWGETGRPGYGLYDRALGASYLNGLWEAVK
jgi:mannonate dehydratase